MAEAMWERGRVAQKGGLVIAMRGGRRNGPPAPHVFGAGRARTGLGAAHAQRHRATDGMGACLSTRTHRSHHFNGDRSTRAPCGGAHRHFGTGLQWEGIPRRYMEDAPAPALRRAVAAVLHPTRTASADAAALYVLEGACASGSCPDEPPPHPGPSNLLSRTASLAVAANGLLETACSFVGEAGRRRSCVQTLKVVGRVLWGRATSCAGCSEHCALEPSALSCARCSSLRVGPSFILEKPTRRGHPQGLRTQHADRSSTGAPPSHHPDSASCGADRVTGYLMDARTVEAAYVTLLEGARAERLHRVPVAATCARLLKSFLPRYVPPASTLACIDAFCG